MNDSFESVDYGKMHVGMTIDEINKRCEKARKEGAKNELEYWERWIIEYLSVEYNDEPRRHLKFIKEKIQERLKELME